MNKLLKKKRFLILTILIILNLSIGIFVIRKQPLTWNFEQCEAYRIIEEFSKEGKFHFDQINPIHIGDPWIVTFLSIPFYHFLHSPFLSLYSINLMLSIFILLTTFLFLERFFDYRIAIMSCLLFVFAPSFPLGGIKGLQPRHYLSFLLGFLAIFLFYTIFFDKSKKEKYKHFAILGFLIGFSIWVHILIIPTFVFILFFWFIFDKKFFFKKKFIIFAIFLLVGSSPVIYYFLTHKIGSGLLRVSNMGHDIFELPENMFSKFKQVINEISLTSGKYFIFIILTLSSFPLFLMNYKNIFRMLKDVFLIKSTQKLNPEIPLIFFILLNFLIIFLTNFSYVFIYIFYSLSITTSIFLTRLPKKFGIKAIGFLVFVLMIVLGLSEITSKLIFAEEYPQFYTESCYDITGYNIAFAFGYWREPLLLEKNCDKMNENKYYCYKAAGNLIGQNILNLSSAQDFCEKLKFKEWCYEGLYEEIGSHLVGNFTVIKDTYLRHFNNEKWNDILFPEDIKRYNIPNITININGCEKFPDEYKPFCYYGASKSWVYYNEFLDKILWNEPNNLREYMKICNLIENTSNRRYCYVGFFKKINASAPPYITNPEICELMGSGCDNFCYEGISKEIAFRYPNASIAEYACQSMSNGDTFLKICYKNIGYYLADEFRYNLSYANEYCDKLNKGKEECHSGIKNFLKKVDIEPNSCNLNNTIYVSGSNIIIDCKNSLLKGCHSNKETPPWLMGIYIRNSKNITIRNCEVSNFTVNLFIYDSSDVFIENVTLHDGFFRNLFGKSVNNLILKNVKAYNAWRDNSIDFSDCCSKNIEITDSSIYNSNVGIRLKGIENVKIKNTLIKNITKCSMVIEAPPEEVLLENVTYDPKCKVMAI
jgi:hypothetical protein